MIALHEKKINVRGDIIKSDTYDITFIGIYFKNDSAIIALRNKIQAAIQDTINMASKFYKPHFTITRMQEDTYTENALDMLKNFPEIDMTLNRIAICDSQPNGTISRVFTAFALK